MKCCIWPKQRFAIDLVQALPAVGAWANQDDLPKLADVDIEARTSPDKAGY